MGAGGVWWEQVAEMDVDQAIVEAEPEDETPTTVELGEAPQAEQADIAGAAASAVVVTPPKTAGNVTRGSSLPTVAAPILPLQDSSSFTSAAAIQGAPFLGRTGERVTPAPAAAAGSNQYVPFGGTPSSTGFTQRLHVPLQPGAGSNTAWLQSQPGNRSKSNN